LRTDATAAAILVVCLGFGETAGAQASMSGAPRPWGRVSFHVTTSESQADDGSTGTFNELTTSVAYHLPDTDESGFDFGIDLRHSRYPTGSRPTRLSLYEGFVGGRFAEGSAVLRLGQVWASDLGSLGSVAGALFEYRQPRLLPEDGRFRAGAFAGLEPNVLEIGYAPGVKKFGGYLAYDGNAVRRHAVGYVLIKDASLTERAVVSTTNFVSAGDKLFVYQAAEYDIARPAGRAERGLAYLFATVRVVPAERLELQGTLNRGRSIDARTLSQDVIDGRPISTAAIEGLLYESLGARVTVEAAPQVRIYVGYSRDKNNRDADPTGRTILGGYASNIMGSGLDLTASDSQLERPEGRYHSRYVSVGHQLGRAVYLSCDYSTSLSIVRFSRSDGIVVETRPHTTRLSGNMYVNVGRSISILVTGERARDDHTRDLRLLSGISYRMR
jgi:hypothetical protein